GVGLGRDTAADGKTQPALRLREGPDQDAAVGLAVEAEIEERAAVRSAGDPLQFRDNLHRSNLRRAGDRAAGKRGGDEVEKVLAFPESTSHIGNQMLNGFV